MNNTNLWLGSQASYEVAIAAHAQALSRIGNADNQQPPLPSILTVQDNVGIIDIKGSMINGNAGFMSWFGVTGYGDIRDALVAAIQHPDINAIMLNIDSPGGAVAGVHETAQLISRVDKIKPVISYTGGTQASAALWLGSSARSAYVAETGLMGSLGILMVHAEKSQQLANDGVKVTVIRAGSEKALANPYEPLTKDAKTALEAKAATMYDIFLGHVANQRGVSPAVGDKQFGQGREFIGKDAVAANLADAVGTMEDAFIKASKEGMKIAAKKPTGTPSTNLNTQTNVVRASLVANVSEVLADTLVFADTTGHNDPIVKGTPMLTPLTQEQLIAMAAGVTLDAVTAAAPATEVTTPASTVEPVTPPAATPATPAASAATPPAAEVGTASAVIGSTPNELVAYLETQVKDLQAALLTAKMEAKTATDSLAISAEQLGAFAVIARNSIKTMTVALGGKPESVDTLAISAIVNEHSRIAEVFKSKFKVGGVAATSTVEEPAPAKAQVDPLYLHAVQSLSK